MSADRIDFEGEVIAVGADDERGKETTTATVTIRTSLAAARLLAGLMYSKKASFTAEKPR